MAEAADYFIAALDRFDQARERRHQRKLEQERHDIYMRDSNARFDTFQKQQQAQTSFEQELTGLMQDTADRITPHVGELNEVRGNTGFGTKFAFVPQEDGSVIMGTVDESGSGVAPLTADPKDMASARLHIPADRVKDTVGRMNQALRATEGDPEARRQLIQNQFGLLHDEGGRTMFQDDPEVVAMQQASEQEQVAAVGAPGLQPSVAGAAPVANPQAPVRLSPTGRITNPSEVAKDPGSIEAAAKSGAVVPTAQDQKRAEELEADPNNMARYPKHTRVRLAVLGLRAGMFTADQAMNMAQTGYSNMNEQDLLDKGLVRRRDQIDYLTKVAQYNDLGRQISLDTRLKEAQIASSYAGAAASAARGQYYANGGAKGGKRGKQSYDANGRPVFETKEWKEMDNRTKVLVEDSLRPQYKTADKNGKAQFEGDVSAVMASYRNWVGSEVGVDPSFYEGHAAGAYVQNAAQVAQRLIRNPNVNLNGNEFSYAMFTTLAKVPPQQEAEFVNHALGPGLQAFNEKRTASGQSPISLEHLVNFAVSDPSGTQQFIREELDWDMGEQRSASVVDAERAAAEQAAAAQEQELRTAGPSGIPARVMDRIR
ncbi:hypothetical protein HNR62_000289 [Oceanisphaera litoralis]|uniref:hypothetical protein n=1 Tax=Oceanisphaera litoralis TaxID=225144 RepID=UPI0019595481|nr:hypothetical protein [Oceanisphaera litoralis]MBM7454460.1 hypothetical protein [Oceanisphaera litoralis]